MDFPYDYMRMLLAKEIDVAAELQKTEISGRLSAVLRRWYDASWLLLSKFDGRSLARQHKTWPPLQEAAAGGKTFSYIRL